jgi:hypothetical protein
MVSEINPALMPGMRHLCGCLPGRRDQWYGVQRRADSGPTGRLMLLRNIKPTGMPADGVIGDESMNETIRTCNHRFHLQLVQLSSCRYGRYCTDEIPAQCPPDPFDVLRPARPHFCDQGPFRCGADGVLITGCHPGECHYLEQNYKSSATLSAAAAHAGPDWESNRKESNWFGPARPKGVRLAHRNHQFRRGNPRHGPLGWPTQ